MEVKIIKEKSKKNNPGNNLDWTCVLADITFLLLLFFLVTSQHGSRTSQVTSRDEGMGENFSSDKNLPVYDKASIIEKEKHIEGLLLKIKTVDETDNKVLGRNINFDKIIYFLGENVVSPDSLMNLDNPEDISSCIDSINGTEILRYCNLAEQSKVRKWLKLHIRKLKSAEKYVNFIEDNNLKVQIEAEKGILFGDINNIMTVCYNETLRTMPFKVLTIETKR